MQNIHIYNIVTQKLRQYFQEVKGFIEVPTQSRLSILAACEDPKTISQFNFNGINYPLPQTGQMWLEIELLKNPEVPGVFCVSTSYRNEPRPIIGRHEKIFPMFEFEAKGDLNALRQIEKELLEHLGFDTPKILDYEEVCKHYAISEIDAEHELKMQKEFGDSISLENFPIRTSPFWNMKQGEPGIFKKIDVILHGMETIGSAERATNVEEMRNLFYTISDGQYAKLLFNAFGKERVVKELEEFLSLPMFPRFGGGIGVTRIARAMQLADLLFPVNQCRELAS